MGVWGMEHHHRRCGAGISPRMTSHFVVLVVVVANRGLVGSAFDHRSLPPEFESRRGHI